MPRFRGRRQSYANVGRRSRGLSKVFGKHGLHHEFSSRVTLTADSNSWNDTIIPICACDSTLGNPDSIYVNPRHSSLTTSNDHLTYGSSVVKRIHYQIDVMLDDRANGTTNPNLPVWKRLEVMPLIISYDDLDKEAGGETVGSYLPLVEHGSDEKIRPNWSGTDLDTMYTNDCWDSDGLTTDAKWESIDFNADNFRTALAEKPISPLLRKLTNGGLKQMLVSSSMPQAYNGFIKLPKKAQLQTEHTFYGLLLHVPTEDTSRQIGRNADQSNTNIWFNFNFSFFEWNKGFNQNVS